MARKKAAKPHETNILDYSASMSNYEKESLAAEAKLAQIRRNDKTETAKEQKADREL